MFRRQLAARWQVLAGIGAVALICAGCGTTSPPRAVGTEAHGPIVSLVTARLIKNSRPRGDSQYFPVRTRQVYAAAILGDLHGATQLVMTWSRLTASGPQMIFSRTLPVSNYELAYTSAVTAGTLPAGTYQVSASVDAVTRSVYWTVFTPARTSAATFAASAAPLRPGPSGSLPQFIPKMPCAGVQNTISMPAETDVKFVLSAYCPSNRRNGPTRGVVLATMNRNAGERLVGRLRLQHAGMLAGSFDLDICKLPGGSNAPGAVLYYASIVYFRGVARNFSGTFILPPAHLAPVVIISSSVPAGTVVHPGERIVLHVTAAEPAAFSPELAVRSIVVTGPAGQVVQHRGYPKAPPRGCDTTGLRKTITVTYTVPAGAPRTLTLTASAAGAPGRSGTARITFLVGS